MAILYFLLIFMIVAAIMAIELEDLVSSVVALFSAGLALCITFTVLKAPDVAIMQLIVEPLALLVLIKATLRRDLPFSLSGRWYVNTFIYLGFFITLFAVATKCFKDLSVFGSHFMKGTGEVNLVSIIILKYRIFDSLGEAAILFVAVIAVLTIIRPKGKKNE